MFLCLSSSKERSLDSQKQKFMEKLDQEKTEQLGCLEFSILSSYFVRTCIEGMSGTWLATRRIWNGSEVCTWAACSCDPTMGAAGLRVTDTHGSLRNDYSLAMKCAHRIYSLKDCLSASGTWAMYICIIFGKHPWSHSQENLEKAVVRVQSFVDRERLFGRSLSSSAVR